MKKNKLIKLLQEIKGNPDIYLWNGFVQDFVDIDSKFVQTVLVKETSEHLYGCLLGEAIKDKEKFPDLDKIQGDAINLHKTCKWEFPNPFLDSEQYKRWYGSNEKKVVIIQAKVKGEVTWDRLGDIKY
jgi:hypothetical protein